MQDRDLAESQRLSGRKELRSHPPRKDGVVRRGLVGLVVALTLVTVSGCGPNASSGSGRNDGHEQAANPGGALTSTSTSSAGATPSSGPATFFSVPTASLSALSVYDWDGDLVGHGAAAVPLECCAVEQSPDGSVLQVGTSTGTAVLGRLGNLVQNLTGPLAWGVWAQDDVHRCVMEEGDNDSAVATLYVVGPGGDSREVTSLNGFGPHEETEVLSCNVADNYALLSTIIMGGVESLIKVRLSDGTTLWKQQANASNSACASPQVISQGDTYEAAGSATQGVVCDIATGRVVAHLQGQPVAISWAGHVVIEVLSAPPNSFSLEAIDWQTGAVLWHNQSAAERHGLVPEVQTQDEPNADAIALTTVPNPVPTDYSQDLAELWLIRPGYQALELSTQAEPGAV